MRVDVFGSLVQIYGVINTRIHNNLIVACILRAYGLVQGPGLVQGYVQDGLAHLIYNDISDVLHWKVVNFSKQGLEIGCHTRVLNIKIQHRSLCELPRPQGGAASQINDNARGFLS